MVGKDYQLLGTQQGIRTKIDENIQGPIKLKFISRDLIGIIDFKKTLYVESLSKGLVSKIISDPYDILKEEREYLENVNTDIPENTIKMFIQDISSISNKTLAICGKSNNIEVVNTVNWLCDNSIARLAEAREIHNNMFTPTSMDILNIGTDKIICLCQTAVNRIQIIDFNGKILATLGEAGIQAGQFRNPTSISCYIDSAFKHVNINDEFVPSWFVQRPVEDIYKAVSSQEPGSFFVVKRSDSDTFYDLIFMDDYYNINQCAINMEDSSLFVTKYNGEEFTGDSLLGLLKNFKHLKNVNMFIP